MEMTTPTITVRPSEERGKADHGWLDTRFSFSFAHYMDPAHMGFRSLRVINQDKIAPGGGFPTHPHDNMEIFSYVLEGALAHKDSMGNERVLRPGEIQLMSAGSGVTHSEFNPSDTEICHLLQIWIHPNKGNLEPTYTEWKPDDAVREKEKVLVISHDGRDASATIRQDADIYRLKISPGNSVEHELGNGRGLWLQVIDGPVNLNDVELNSGDGAKSEGGGEFQISAKDEPVEAILFDLG